MYCCDECGHFFDEPIEVVYEAHSELPGAPREYRNGCPKCKSPYIDEAYICGRCGVSFPFSEVCYKGDDMYCEDCIDELEYENELKGEVLNATL